jgi:mono/diheme cytochrome c family protein
LLQHEPGIVADYDSETGRVLLTVPLDSAPAEGDRIALGPGKVLQHGRMLYAEHCQHCHGVTGDGGGPTAEYLNPLPRDYRQGLFKFTSTMTGRRAQRDDLARTIENGIPGTYMPSFKLLEPDEMTPIVEYVLWLSMRGETEYMLVDREKGLLSLDWSKEAVADVLPGQVEEARKRLEDYQQKLSEYQSRLQELQAARADPEEIAYVAGAIEIIENNTRITEADIADPSRITRRQFAERFDDLMADTEDVVFTKIITDWTVSQTEDSLVFPKTPRIPSSPESIRRGREVFLNASAKCATCHGDAGLGNGDQTLRVQQGQTEPGLFDDWGHPIQPRNLTSGIYRGGRRPIDIYRRIYAGIKGTPMTGFGTVFQGPLDDDEALGEDDLWHLVNYVLSIPFEERAPGEGGFVPSEGPATTQQVAATEPASSSATDN